MVPRHPAVQQPAKRNPRRVILRWIARLGGGLLALLLLLLIAAAGYQAFWEWQQAKKHPAPGKLVDVDGRMQHLYCTGAGSPTVILDSGHGGTWMDWALVQPEVAKFTRVCSYDRAGMGWSAPGPLPRDSHRIAAELNALLARASEQPPYVLVGHSVAGYHVRVFAARYREQVGGMVLVDAAHEEMFERLPPEVVGQLQEFGRLLRTLRYGLYFGIPRWQGICGQPLIGLEHLKELQTFNQCRASMVLTLEQELAAVHADARQAAAAARFGDLPLLVVSRDYSQPDADLPPEIAEKARAAGDAMQEELAGLSTRGRRIAVAGSGHYVQLDRPQAVIQAIQEVVEAVRRP